MCRLCPLLSEYTVLNRSLWWITAHYNERGSPPTVMTLLEILLCMRGAGRESNERGALPIFDFPSSYLVRCSTWWTILLLVELEKKVSLLLIVKLENNSEIFQLFIMWQVPSFNESGANKDAKLVKSQFVIVKKKFLVHSSIVSF